MEINRIPYKSISARTNSDSPRRPSVRLRKHMLSWIIKTLKMRFQLEIRKKNHYLLDGIRLIGGPD